MSSDLNSKFWELTYNQGALQQYGIEYEGKITTIMINDPTIISHDFYARLASNTFRQPLICGGFEAQTVGGYAKK